MHRNTVCTCGVMVWKQSKALLAVQLPKEEQLVLCQVRAEARICEYVPQILMSGL